MSVQIKRIYEPVEPADGIRVLVDALWPRGISKERAQLHSWRKDLAPTAEVRTSFDHQADRWVEFRDRYRQELSANPGVGDLVSLAEGRALTLLYSAKNVEQNQAFVLAEFIREQL